MMLSLHMKLKGPFPKKMLKKVEILSLLQSCPFVLILSFFPFLFSLPGHVCRAAF